jgi:hypothetical protein
MSDGTGGNANTGDTGNTGNTGQGADGGAGKVEFTPEQQEYIDTLIGRKYAEAHTKAQAKFQPEMDTLKAQIQELQANKGEDKNKGNGEDLTALKERLAAMEQSVKTSQERERRSRLNAIAAELNAVNAEQVTALIAPSIKVGEDGNVVVLNAEGQTRFNGEGKPMGVKEYVKEFLDTNPHFVKAGGNPGAGSQGAKFDGDAKAKTMKRGDYDALSPQAQSEFIKAGGRPVD